MKKKGALSLVLASLLILTSCGAPATPPDADPKEVLQSAREHFVDDTLKSLENQLVGAGTGKLDLEATVPEGNLKGTISLETEAKGNKEGTESSAAMKLSANLEGMVEKIGGKGEIALEVKIIDEVLYFLIDKMDAQSDDPSMKESIAQGKAFLDLYSKKWFKLDTKALGQELGDANILKPNTYAEAAKMLALVKSNEIFEVVETLPPADGMYVYKVKPSVEGNINLIKQLVQMTPAGSEWTAQDEEALRELLTLMGGENVIHTLYIDGATKKYKKFVSEGKINNDEIEGTISVTLNSPKENEMDISMNVQLTDKADTSRVITMNAEAKRSLENLNASMSIQAPGEGINISLKGTTTFQKKEVTIQAPEGATDLAQMLSAFGLTGGSQAGGSIAPMEGDLSPTPALDATTTVETATDANSTPAVAE